MHPVDVASLTLVIWQALSCGLPKDGRDTQASVAGNAEVEVAP